MKHFRSRTALRRSLARWLSVLLLGTACQTPGRVREAPPPVFPADALEAPSPAPAQPETVEPSFAAPPEPRASDATGGPSSDTRSLDDEADEDDENDPGAEPERWAPELGVSPTSNAPGARAEAKAASPARPRGVEEQRGSGAVAADPGARDRSSAWRRPPAEERPGLATHWGEDRYSPAREVDFERAHATRPALLVELHYNDRAGARRMLPDAGWARAERRATSGLTVRVLDAEGQTLPALVRGERVVAVGEPGERYTLAIENSTSQRFEVVASVDGLDVMDGQAARVDKRGYLVAAWSSVSIDGFRRSNAEVAAFRLGNVSRSYAASKGQARNVGVLGFAFFDERRAPPPPSYGPVARDTRLRRNADPFPGGYAQPPVW